MTPYPEYKATNLPWLPQIPAHWELVRNKNVLKEQKDTVGKYSSQYTLLSLTLYGIIPRDMENCKGKFPAEFDNYKIVRCSDIVFCLFDIDETPRAVGLSGYSGMITGAYDVFSITNVNPRFLYYYYLNIDNQKALKPYYTGLRKVVNIARFLSLQFPIPSVAEQEQIVRYLDSMTAKINKLIRAKKKQIALLQEQKQNIISTTMTSEIEASKSKWEVMRLKHTTNVPLQYGANAVGIPFDENEIRYIRITDIDSHGNLKISEKQSLPKEIGKEYKLQNGDILFARCGGTVGKTYLYNPKDGICCYAGYLIRYRPNKAIVLPEYIYLYTQSSVYKKWLQQIFIQATIQNVSAEKYKNLTILIPLLAEQKNIVLYLKKVLSEAENIIQTIERQISCLIEYKNSLIASVVTGQVDVRNIQVEEFDPADLISETDDDPAEDNDQPQEESEE